MPTVMLLSKIYSNHQLKLVEDYVKSSFKGLKVRMESVETTINNWVQITFYGEDEKAALSYLENEIGLCPVHMESLKRLSAMKGYLTSLGKSKDEICVDIGIISPKTVYATIPLQQLQAQLADGRKIALKKLAEFYGFWENLPLTVKVIELNENHIEATIAETQLKLYKRWVKSLLDRLIILGAPRYEIRKALKDSKCQNDIVEIESLGLFEYAVACKLGTDAVGLIPKIGKHLPNATLRTFNPKTLLELFQGLFINL